MSGSKRGFTLVELLVVISIIGMLMSLLLPAVQSARESGRRTTCLNNMRNVGLAFQSYDQNKKKLPGWSNPFTQKDGTFYVAGLDLVPENPVAQQQPQQPSGPNSFSWVVSLFPYLERLDLDEAWKNLADRQPAPIVLLEILTCPSDITVQQSPTPLSFVVNCGMPDSWAYNQSQGNTILTRTPYDFPGNGVFYNQDPDIVYNYGTTITSIASISLQDGTTNTLMVSENLDDAENVTNWLPVNQDNRPATGTGSGGGRPREPYEREVGFVWFDAENPSGPYPSIPRNRINGKHTGQYSRWATADGARPSSHHPGGVNVVFCDGHTGFLRQEIDYLVYCALMTTQGSQVRVAGIQMPVTGHMPVYDGNSNGKPDIHEYILNAADYQ